eukprot:5867772-Pyramimonas_sp.AAC.1
MLEMWGCCQQGARRPSDEGDDAETSEEVEMDIGACTHMCILLVATADAHTFIYLESERAKTILTHD